MSPSASRGSRPRLAWSLDRLQRESAELANDALARSTSRTYDYALDSWVDFIRLHPQIPFKPSAKSLSFYITWMSSGRYWRSLP